MQINLKISFIGGGNMAQALIGGLAGKLIAADHIHVVDINADALASLAQRFGVTTAASVDAAVASADVIVLSVKPQQMREVADVTSALSNPLGGGVAPEDLELDQELELTIT